MPKGKYWSQEEIDFIKKNYQKMSCGEMTKHINRTYNSIRFKVLELNLKKDDYKWSESQIKILKNNYLNLSNKQLSEKIGRTSCAVQNKIKVLGLQRPDKFLYDINFFENIDNEEKAYWLGFIFADGYIHQTKLNAELGIELSLKDIEHLKKFNKSLKGNVPITQRERDRSNSKFIKADKTYSCCIRLYRKKIVEDLRKYGINENKTYTDNYISKLIPKNLVKHFIRGYFDGDGNIWGDNNKNKQLKYTIYGLSRTILEDIRQDLIENNIYSQIISDDRDLYLKTQTCYRLIIGGIENAYNFYNYIYNDSNIYMDRKFEYATKYIEKYNIKERANKKHQRNCLSNQQ